MKSSVIKKIWLIFLVFLIGVYVSAQTFTFNLAAQRVYSAKNAFALSVKLQNTFHSVLPKSENRNIAHLTALKKITFDPPVRIKNSPQYLTFSNIVHTFPFQFFMTVFGIVIIILMLVIIILFIKNQLRKQKNRELQYKADFDILTGLWNRNKFYADTRQLLKENPDTKFVIMISDIARFKVINDQFGVPTGDKLLRYIADDIKAQKREKTTYGYLESDHFVFCFPYSDSAFNEWHDHFLHYLKEFDLDFEIIPYFGLYQVINPDIEISLMIDRARLALSKIKGNYMKHFAYYDDELRNMLLSEQEVINEMNHALAEKHFEVYLQPQYNHVTGELVSSEALVRWIHPKKGIIPPGKFIPVFEKNGFITKLDEYVWERACQILASWRERDIKLIPISVNISRRDIYNAQLPDILLTLVTKYQIPTGYLKLEITASAYVDNAQQLIDTVKRLQKMRFIVEMDDFGSGYSSLNTLKDVPVDVLKLDLKFLAKNTLIDDDSHRTDERGGNILNSVVRMAKWLNLPVIAEGVETLSQADYLKSIGCHLVQGYLYSPPIPLVEFEKLMEKSTAGSETDMEKIHSQLDLNYLWNPESQASVFFDRYMDASCLLEYHSGNMEILRVNDSFFDMLKISRDCFDKIRTNLRSCIYSEDLDCFNELIMDSIRTRQKSECFIRFNIHNIEENSDEIVTLRVRLRFVAMNGERYLFFVTIENISTLTHVLEEEGVC